MSGERKQVGDKFMDPTDYIRKPVKVTLQGKDRPPEIDYIDTLKPRLKSKYESNWSEDHAETVIELCRNQEGHISLAHLASELNCSVQTITRWRKEHPEFDAAVIFGFSLSEQKWRNRLEKVAFKPASQVNNVILSLLSKTMYGMDNNDNVVINNHQEQKTYNKSPEEEMKNRGIPIPDIGMEDLDE